MKFTVEPVTVENCDCEACKAGKHLYELHQWSDNQWQFVGVSLQSYASAQECKLNHYWGVQFTPEDTWEDGTPIVKLQKATPEEPPSGTERMVPLDTKAIAESFETLQKHWLK